MERAASSNASKNAYIICAFVGAFIGFLVPETKTLPPQRPGIPAAMIAFEVNHSNLIMTLGALLLLYWLSTRKAHGPQALVMSGALGFCAVQLLLASLRVLG
jgi:hypothetical protein